MPEYADASPTTPQDICLMLRAHAELSCLSFEVMPVLRQLESREDLPDEQVGAALAYLEVTWLEAGRRAAETDAAHTQLAAASGGLAGEGLAGGGLAGGGLANEVEPAGDGLLGRCAEDDKMCGKACRYHRAVKQLREAIAIRVAPLLASPEPATPMVLARRDGEARPRG